MGEREDTTEATRPASCPGLRERKKARTREKLIDAALDLFEHQGFEATTVQQIADEVGVSRRTFNRYFTSKEHPVLSYEDELMAELLRVLMNRPAGESAITAVRRAISEMASYHILRSQHDSIAPKVRRVRRLVNGDPVLRGENLKRVGTRETLLAQCFADRAGLASTVDRRPVLAAAVCATAIRIATDEWMLGDDPGIGAWQRQVDAALAVVQNGTDIPGRPG